MEHLCGDIWEVTHHEDDEGLNDTDMIGEAWHEGSQEAEEDAYAGASQDHDEEGQNAEDNVQWDDVLFSDFSQAVEKMIQNLEMKSRRPNVSWVLEKHVGFRTPYGMGGHLPECTQCKYW